MANSSIYSKSETDLDLLFTESNKYYKAGEIKSATRLTLRGLDAARERNDSRWEDKFDALHSQIRRNVLRDRYSEFKKDAQKAEKQEEYARASELLAHVKENLNSIFKLGLDQKKILDKIRTIDKKIAELRAKEEIQVITHEDIKEEPEIIDENESSQVPNEYDPFYDHEPSRVQKELILNPMVSNVNQVKDDLDYDKEELSSNHGPPRVRPSNLRVALPLKNNYQDEKKKEEEDVHGGLEDIDEEIENIEPINIVDEPKEKNMHDINQYELSEVVQKIKTQKTTAEKAERIKERGKKGKETTSKKSHLPNKRRVRITDARFTAERLHQKTMLDMLGKMKRILKDDHNYRVLDNKSTFLRSDLRHLNLLAMKVISINSYTKILHLLPLKIMNVKGNVVVREDAIGYKSKHERYRGNRQVNKLLVGSHLSAMESVRETMYSQIQIKGKLFSQIETYLAQDLAVRKSLGKDLMFLHDNRTEYKIIIDPVFACAERVGFSEHTINFAYQKEKNFHYIDFGDLDELLTFLEEKYYFVEHYAHKESAIDRYSKGKEEYFGMLGKISIPSMMLGATLLLLLLLQPNPDVITLLSLSIGAAIVYGLILGIFTYKYYRSQEDLSKEFRKPYHLRPFKIEKRDMLDIYDYFISNDREDFMNQFIYETLGKNLNNEIEYFFSKHTPNHSLKKEEEPQRKSNRRARKSEKNNENENEEAAVDMKKLASNLKHKFSSYLEE